MQDKRRWDELHDKCNELGGRALSPAWPARPLILDGCCVDVSPVDAGFFHACYGWCNLHESSLSEVAGWRFRSKEGLSKFLIRYVRELGWTEDGAAIDCSLIRVAGINFFQLVLEYRVSFLLLSIAWVLDVVVAEGSYEMTSDFGRCSFKVEDLWSGMCDV